MKTLPSCNKVFCPAAKMIHDDARQRRTVLRAGVDLGYGFEARRLFLLRLNKKHNSPTLYFPIVKNREQRNMFGQKVSTCRPDIQYNYSYSNRYLEEFFWAQATMLTVNKMLVMNRADPFARQIGWNLGRRR